MSAASTGQMILGLGKGWFSWGVGVGRDMVLNIMMKYDGRVIVTFLSYSSIDIHMILYIKSQLLRVISHFGITRTQAGA